MSRLTTRIHRQADRGSFVARIRHQLDTNFAQPFSLAELADSVEVSPGHLLHEFSRAFGKPPRAYLIEVRVRRACKLMEAGTPIKCAAKMVGFYDQAHLTRHFKHLMGDTPAHYVMRRRSLS